MCGKVRFRCGTASNVNGAPSCFKIDPQPGAESLRSHFGERKQRMLVCKGHVSSARTKSFHVNHGLQWLLLWCRRCEQMLL